MINRVPNWQDLSDQECLDWLLAVDTKPSNRGRLTHEWVSENVSLAVADAVFAAISEVSPPSAQRYNVGNGIDTTAELWKTQANALASAGSPLSPHLKVLRDFELITGPRWQLWGIESEPTITSVAESRQDELDRIAAEEAAQQRRRDYQDLRNWLVSLSGSALFRLKQMEDAGDPAPTKTEILDLLGGE